MKTLIILGFLSLSLTIQAQSDKLAYSLFNGSGNSVSYKKMVNNLAEADVILVGEYHNNPISHWMELQITQSLYTIKNKEIILGAEMFESDTQLMLTEYVDSVISTSRFEEDCRLWKNYKTDYKPLVEFARTNKIKFVATNVPRRYADMVNKSGGEAVLQTLSNEAKQYIAPLPILFKPDSILIKEISRAGMMSSKNSVAIAKAQAVKDATMAWFIAKNFQKGKTFIHFNGSFHSDYYTAILYYLMVYSPDLKVVTISTIEQDSVEELDKEFKNRADYILAIPKSMIKTY